MLRPKVVLSGSYKRSVDALQADFDTLGRLGCQILSPSSVHFTGDVEGFVLTAEDEGRPVRDIELGHLRAIAAADFVWLHAPGGYVGVSGALEIGYAHASRVPVFTRETPSDVTLREFVVVVRDASAAVESVRSSNAVSSSACFDALERMQSYYLNAAIERGYSRESLTDTVVLLTEELGELARAVRKRVQLPRHGTPITKSIADEIADVFLYLLHLANIAGIDMARAVREKEEQNSVRARTTNPK